MGALESQINSLLLRFADMYDADVEDIDHVDFEGVPKSISFLKYKGTEFEPLLHLAKRIDDLIYSFPLDACSRSSSKYIQLCKKYLMENERIVSLDLKCPIKDCSGELKAVVGSERKICSCFPICKVCQEKDGGYSSETQKYIEEMNGAVKCPKCSATMIKRVAKNGPKAGKAFWGCSQYPKCSGTKSIKE